MCGIVAVVNLQGEPVGYPLLKRMTDAIAHRGPDGEGHFLDREVGLGHRRLAIIDLTPAGRQPMGNEDGQVVVTYNGEIYNFQQLRAELESRGHRFHSKTDSEVIVHAWEEWGEEALQRLNGMFAFALWDARTRRLVLARDRYGIKPLYYYTDGRCFVAASEIKGILQHHSVSRRLDARALNEYFTFQNVLSDRTLFEGIRMVPAGHWMTVDAREGVVREPVRYWDFCLAHRPEVMDPADAAADVYQLFQQAVSRQLVSDVPVGSYLSGGMDSGSITAVARLGLGRLTTFTCGFDLTSASGLELSFDERSNAEVLANHLKTEHYEVVLHAGDMEHVMPELVWHVEDLRVGQCYPNYYVARLASKFVKVVLSGAAGDELFAGYPWRYYRAMHSEDREQFFREYYGFWQRLVADELKPQLFVDDVWRQLQDYSTFDVFRSILRTPAIPDELTDPEQFVSASLYFELKTFLHGLLVVEDKISMAHGLETRVPFLDNDLVDYVMRLPPRLKLRNVDAPAPHVDEDDVVRRRRQSARSGDGKLVLRDAMTRIIPQSVTSREKQGFSAPDASWFRGESIDYVNSLLRDPRARMYEYLKPGLVLQRLDEHTSGKHNHRLFIWSLLSFEWWLRQFFDGSQHT
jgi:asparagine synthase (glutamine-hydrolysing)